MIEKACLDQLTSSPRDTGRSKVVKKEVPLVIAKVHGRRLLYLGGGIGSSSS